MHLEVIFASEAVLISENFVGSLRAHGGSSCGRSDTSGKSAARFQLGMLICGASQARRELAPNNEFRERHQRESGCATLCAKISYFFFTENMVRSRHPASSERGVRVVTIRRGGLRWTCRRQLTSATARTAKSCGPGAPVLALSREALTRLADDGGKNAGPRGERV
jgi:hypothetical protein